MPDTVQLTTRPSTWQRLGYFLRLGRPTMYRRKSWMKSPIFPALQRLSPPKEIQLFAINLKFLSRRKVELLVLKGFFRKSQRFGEQAGSR